MPNEKEHKAPSLTNPILQPIIHHDSVESMKSPKLAPIEPQWQVQDLSSQRFTRFAIGCVLIVFFLLTPLYKIHQRAEAVLIESSILYAQNVSKEGISASQFGTMAKRISAITQVAEHMKANSELDQKPLDYMIEQTFPWWVQSQSIYTPWQKERVPPESTSLLIPVGRSKARLAADLIATVRHVLYSDIPIEVAYAGHSDLPLSIREKLRIVGGPNITFIDVTQTFDDDYVSFAAGKWAIKPFAMLASRYPRTILVDADTIIFTDPSTIFSDDKDLRRTGIRLFHDRLLQPNPDRTSWLKDQLAQAGRAEYPTPALNNSLFWQGVTGEMVDSGMVIWDKTRPANFLALMYIAWMNTREPRVSETYERWYGDKETWFIGPELMGVEYSMDPAYAGHIGVLEPDWPGPSNDVPPMSFCSEHVFHAHPAIPSPRRRKHKYIPPKPWWLNGGLYYSKNRLELGYANFTHWWPGSADPEVQKWQMRDSPQMTGWMCARAPKEEVREVEPEFAALWERMVEESKAVDQLFA
ncbi:MAG: hypothetical protein Q9227_006081 [Pyrenula ochraceoflavens]